jgi:pimeloyl-ACP methyl ester carboxylesterase
MQMLGSITVFAFLAAASVSPSQAAQPSAPRPTVSSEIGRDYARSHDMIDVGHGRRMNLFCMGKGATAVVFDSGLSDWSSIWALVQPTVAKTTRACSYDRAGMGYSDTSSEPAARSPIAIVEDLHTLLHAAKVVMPVIVVGHSLGGFNMKLYAAIYPDDVAGLVLVDPSEDRGVARTGDLFSAKYGAAIAARYGLEASVGVAMGIANYDQCTAATATKDLDPASELYKQCTDPVRTPLGPDIAAERIKIQVKRAYQITQASELANSVYGDPQSDAVYAKLFAGQILGDKPIVVLTHSIYDATDVDQSAEWYGWNALHDQTAMLSRRGVNRVVAGTHHNIEIDQPQAIVDAVAEVLRQVNGK